MYACQSVCHLQIHKRYAKRATTSSVYVCVRGGAATQGHAVLIDTSTTRAGLTESRNTKSSQWKEVKGTQIGQCCGKEQDNIGMVYFSSFLAVRKKKRRRLG